MKTWTSLNRTRRKCPIAVHVFIAQAQRFRSDLAKNRFGPLAKLRAGSEDSDLAVFARFHAIHGTQIPLSRARKARTVQKRSDADSLFAVGTLIFGREAFLLRVIIREFQCAIEKLSKVDGFTHGLASRCGLSGLEKVAPPNLNR